MANSWGIPAHVERAVLLRDTCCVYCGKPFGAERASKPSWELIINDVAIATLDNIALCCVGCNASKGSKPLKTWLYSPLAARRGITAETLSPMIRAALRRDILDASLDANSDSCNG